MVVLRYTEIKKRTEGYRDAASVFDKKIDKSLEDYKKELDKIENNIKKKENLIKRIEVIINEIDDGSKSIEMTINMLKKAEESGTTDIIATPHFMRGRFEVQYKDVIKRAEELKKIVNSYNEDKTFISNDIFEFETSEFKPNFEKIITSKFKKEEDPMSFIPTYLKKTEAEEKLNDCKI